MSSLFAEVELCFDEGSVMVDLEEKMACYRRALERLSSMPNDADIALLEQSAIFLNKLGEVFEGLEDWDTAIKCYETIFSQMSAGHEFLVAITSNLVEALCQRAHLYYTEESYEKAKAFYKQALEKDSSHVVALNQLGMCALKEQDFELARFYFSIQAGPEIEKDDLDVDAWVNLAETLNNLKKHKLAFRAVSVANKISPEEESLTESLPLMSACLLQDVFRKHKARSESEFKSEL